jgi:hypothetical protein
VTAGIIENASAGVVLTRGGDVLPLPGLPDDRLLAPGSPILSVASRRAGPTAARTPRSSPRTRATAASS